MKWSTHFLLRGQKRRISLVISEDLEQINDVDIEEMDIKWQIAMIAIRVKRFNKQHGRNIRFDGKSQVGFNKENVECYKCHKHGHFAKECWMKMTADGKKKDSYSQDNDKLEKNQMSMLTLEAGAMNWDEYTQEEEAPNHELMATGSNNEVSLCSKICIS